jgi:hypothetical protein
MKLPSEGEFSEEVDVRKMSWQWDWRVTWRWARSWGVLGRGKETEMVGHVLGSSSSSDDDSSCLAAGLGGSLMVSCCLVLSGRVVLEERIVEVGGVCY